MWYTLRISPEASPDFVSSTTELLRSTSRTLILATGGLYFIWHLVSTGLWPLRLGGNVLLVTPVVLLACGLALWALPRHFALAQIAWHAGLAGAITFALVLFQKPEIAFFYTLLPLMAAVTLGWPGSLLMEGLVIALAWWLSHGLLGQPVPISFSAGVMTGGAITGVIRWAATRAFFTVTQWSLYSYEQARERIEEA